MTPHRWYPMLGGQVHEDLSVLEGQSSRRGEHRLGALPGHRDEGALELARFTYLERLQDEPQHRHRLLELLQDEDIGPIGRVVEDRHARGVWDHLLE